MPAERFFAPEMYQIGSTILLKEQEYHHLVHVMRVDKGEIIEIINGQGQLSEARLIKIEKHQAICEIEKVFTDDKPPRRLVLAQSLPRLPRLEYLLEKVVELGVDEILLFPGDLSEKKELSPTQLQRLFQILISAMKQCGRLYIPKISLRPPLYAWALEEGKAFFGDTRQGAPPLLTSLPIPFPATFFVGPEKGFSSKEIDLLENKLQATGVSLHKNTLRVDTAAISCISLLSSLSLTQPLNN